MYRTCHTAMPSPTSNVSDREKADRSSPAPNPSRLPSETCLTVVRFSGDWVLPSPVEGDAGGGGGCDGDAGGDGVVSNPSLGPGARKGIDRPNATSSSGRNSGRRDLLEVAAAAAAAAVGVIIGERIRGCARRRRGARRNMVKEI